MSNRLRAYVWSALFEMSFVARLKNIRSIGLEICLAKIINVTKILRKKDRSKID